jgi:hypothetical protein
VDAGGVITTVAGTGTACAATTSLCGDFGPAGLAQLNAPAAITADATDTGYLISDTGDNRVRRVTSGGTITTVIGSAGAASPQMAGAARSSPAA